MRIAVLQFAPKLGAVKENMESAEAILSKTEELTAQREHGVPLWLVLPEMAFTGYNFGGLEEITPFLEPTCSGPSTRWAVRIAEKYKCYVTVGYPEVYKDAPPNSNHIDTNSNSNSNSTPPVSESEGKSTNYNSIITVSPTGEVLFNYRKTFLYYTDETWASEGLNDPPGFFSGNHPTTGPVAMGICMDINPYRFEAAWDRYEFANHVLETRAQLVVVSMAWLTRLSPQELRELPLRPDNETLSYWIERFYPVHTSRVGPVFIVLANRCGIEHSACYAGTSSVICFRDGKGYIYEMLGKWDEQCMVVDLQKAPKYELAQPGMGMSI